MRFRLITILSVTALGACSLWQDSQNFSVYFQSYSAAMDQQARDSVADAASYANWNHSLPVTVTGYAAAADPKLDDRLSAKRADIVKQTLIADGVDASRITAVASGRADPKPLPRLAVQRVDIFVGKTQARDASGAAGSAK